MVAALLDALVDDFAVAGVDINGRYFGPADRLELAYRLVVVSCACLK